LPFSHSKLKVAIVFPESFKNASANLAIHTLYRLLSPSYFTDLFALDTLTGIRTNLKLQDFDLILFTVDYEPNYLNILKILKQTGIEPLAEKRERPILIGGGAAISSNPYPLRPFFDLLAIGEAEVIIPQIMESLEDPSEKTWAQNEWAITPNLKREAKRLYLMDLTQSQSASAFYYSHSTFKMNLIEISRSCPSKCRFCLLSYNALPPRWLPVERFLELTKIFPDNMDLGLVGGSVLDHPKIEEILEHSQRFRVIHPSSVKVSLALEGVLKKLKEKGAQSVTIAPETGSDSLRQKINKGITNYEIVEFSKLVEKLKFKSLKLYFMLGLPEETLEDVEAIGDLLRQIAQNFKGEIQATFSIFVPKPHTPFQYEPIISKDELSKKLKRLKIPKGVKADIGSYKGAVKQLIFSRGSEELGFAMLEHLDGKPLEKLIPVDRILRDPVYVKNLPFNLIDSGVDKTFLANERKKAEMGKLTPRCIPGACKRCGIC